MESIFGSVLTSKNLGPSLWALLFRFEFGLKMSNLFDYFSLFEMEQKKIK